MHLIKTFEQLRDYVYEQKDNVYYGLYNHLEESDRFQLGVYYGMISAYEDIHETIWQSIKHGEVE